ncbi:MAG: PqqD family protein [Solirubrobacteraceae bacterium]|jgi:hypothetical protein
MIAPRRPDVLDETFDGEAVLVNMRTGRYYALDATATEVWELIAAGVGTAADLVAALSRQRTLPPAEVAAGLRPFIERLAAESLIVGDSMALEEAPPSTPSGAFAPSLQVFTDMEDLLLLDPIHEVDLDGTGWPSLSQSL